MIRKPGKLPPPIISQSYEYEYDSGTLEIKGNTDIGEGNKVGIIDDVTANVSLVDTVVFCSGKFYYEMKEKASEYGVENMAFVRLEQLYPLPKKQIDAILAKYKGVKNILWAQEEPSNMGAWTHIAMSMREIPFVGICRNGTAASAEGSKKLHEKRLKQLFEDLFQFAKIKVK
jgi:2-oxoglutarate dehydrogenase E1 component